MTAKQTALIRYQAASRAYELAAEACPHWDYDGDGSGFTCCDALQDAIREKRNAGRQYRLETGAAT